ncbi:MAG: hypothetical protein KY475_11335 [Planctomycetes bacterium]|nr:hypothetical protein [Planctomycetota bacterium]
MVRAVISEEEGRAIRAETLRLAVPADALPPLRQSALVVDAKAEQSGKAVGDILRAAFVDSPKSVEARLGPSAPLQLLAALPVGQRLLGAKPECRGQLHLAANINSPEGSTVAMRLGDAVYSIAWKDSVTLAQEITVTGLSLTVKQATVDAKLSGATFKGSLTGEVEAKRLVVGEYVLEPVKIRIAAANVDSQQPEQLSLCLDVSGKRILPDGPPADLNIKGFRVKLGSGTTAEQAKKKLIKALVDALLLAPDEC